MAKRIPLVTAKSIKKHRFILKTLAKVKGNKRKKILSKAPKSLLTVLGHLFRYVLNGEIPLSDMQMRKLKPHHSLINDNARLTSGAIKANVVQKGGAIGTILATVLPIVSSLLFSLLSKKKK